VKDPVVEVRILNYKVTVYGSVRWPGVVIAPNHRMNVVEAIAAAGDILIEGRKDNVMVIRENAGKREFARVNLNSRNSFANPYFYLKQNDIVYVEAGRLVRQDSHNEFLKFYMPAITSVILSVFGIVSISKISN
jgi:polysaccharide export outer membrane protein